VWNVDNDSGRTMSVEKIDFAVVRVTLQWSFCLLRYYTKPKLFQYSVRQMYRRTLYKITPLLILKWFDQLLYLTAFKMHLTLKPQGMISIHKKTTFGIIIRCPEEVMGIVCYLFSIRKTILSLRLARCWERNFKTWRSLKQKPICHLYQGRVDILVGKLYV
jgi:hypothetical protein